MVDNLAGVGGVRADIPAARADRAPEGVPMSIRRRVLLAGTAVAVATVSVLAVTAGPAAALPGFGTAPVTGSARPVTVTAVTVGSHPGFDRVVLTASGGPFLGKKPNFLVNVKRDHALQHPNWSMGAKVSIDSATLMNKGLEMIEAKWLFNLRPDQIQVVIHPQSIIHSMVQFEDGSIKAQMGLPDMKLPIQYAMAFPQRIVNDFPRYNFKKPSTLSFEEPDLRTFRNLSLAIDALNKGGNMPCILNAANEIAVYAFLKNRIGFLDMTEMVEQTLQKISFIEKPTLEEYFESDGEARNFAASLVEM